MSEDQHHKDLHLNPYQRLRSKEILQEIRANGGEKTFYLGERDNLLCLAVLAAQGLIEEVSTNESFSFTYRLIEKK